MELTNGGKLRLSSDEDGNAGPFPAPECLGHCGHFGGGKPPPPTLPPMGHAGPPAYTEQKALYHCTVCQGSGLEEAADSVGGDEGDHGEGLLGIRGAAGKITAFKYLLPVLMTGDDDWPAVVGKITKARKSWGRLLRILSREGTDPKVLGNVFKRCHRRCCCLGQRHG